LAALVLHLDNWTGLASLFLEKEPSQADKQKVKDEARKKEQILSLIASFFISSLYFFYISSSIHKIQSWKEDKK
jgi:hypothetical protein